jgi:hypothetical protein
MQRSTRRIAALSALAALALPLSGCAKVTREEEQGEKAARVEKVGDTNKVILLAQAAKRLGIETRAVTQDGAHDTVPYSAVIYDAEGHSWVFTTSEELSYVKAPITIDHIDGDKAILTAGPAVGTAVVTQGAEELFGVEDGIGEFE